jgi:hypothetical protein
VPTHLTCPRSTRGDTAWTSSTRLGSERIFGQPSVTYAITNGLGPFDDWSAFWIDEDSGPAEGLEYPPDPSSEGDSPRRNPSLTWNRPSSDCPQANRAEQPGSALSPERVEMSHHPVSRGPPRYCGSRPSSSRVCAAVFVRGKGSSGTSRCRAEQIGSQPSSGCHSRKRFFGAVVLTCSL